MNAQTSTRVLVYDIGLWKRWIATLRHERLGDPALLSSPAGGHQMGQTSTGSQEDPRALRIFGTASREEAGTK